MKINLDQAIDIIKNGGIIIYPTDTAFGIGCRIDNFSSVKKLYELRKRPQNKAVPVLFSSINQVKQYALPFDSEVENLMLKYWPGALTIVLKCDINNIHPLVRGGGDTLGFRIPNSEQILNLIDQVGVPIVGTSANFAGEETPFKLNDLNPKLIKLVDGVLTGETVSRNTSTVLDCTSKPWKIIRQGAVNISI